jgi:hypothetical protein
MRQQAMVAHSDADVDSNDVQDNQEKKHVPAKEEQCRYCAHVKDEHEAEDGPIEGSRLRGAAENEWRLMGLDSRVSCGLCPGVYPAVAGVNGNGFVGEDGGSRCCGSRHPSSIKLKWLCFCRSFVIAGRHNQNRAY